MYSTTAHLWAIGYDNMDGARQMREVAIELAGPEPYLFLLDTLVVVCNADGSFTLERERQHPVANIATAGILGALVGWVLSAPVLAAAVGALLGCLGSVASSVAWIDKKFVEEIKALMKPGTSALLVLDDVGDMDVIIYRIRGLGGTVLRTNVDMKQAQLIQSALSAGAPG